MLTRREVENLKRLTRDNIGWASQHEHEAIATLEATVVALKDAREQFVTTSGHMIGCQAEVDGDCDCGYEFLRQFEGDT